MFRQKEMEKALTWLIGLYRPEDYDAYDEEEASDLDGICFEEICMALRDMAQTVYQYTVESSHEHGFEYRGKELFRMRGCKICSDMEIGCCDAVNTLYGKELWFLEDMSFALVHYVRMCGGTEDSEVVTEYRAIIKRFEGRQDLFVSPETLLETLEEMCVPQWEQTATIYEL